MTTTAQRHAWCAAGCGRPQARGRWCHTCWSRGVRRVHPAPDLARVRVVPWDPDRPDGGCGGGAEMRGGAEL